MREGPFWRARRWGLLRVACNIWWERNLKSKGKMDPWDYKILWQRIQMNWERIRRDSKNIKRYRLQTKENYC